MIFIMIATTRLLDKELIVLAQLRLLSNNVVVTFPISFMLEKVDLVCDPVRFDELNRHCHDCNDIPYKQEREQENFSKCHPI